MVAAAALAVATGSAGAIVAAGATYQDDALTAQAVVVNPVRHQPLQEPPVIRSRGGVAELDLDSRTAVTTIAGSRAISNTYNAMAPGPTVEISPGDIFKVRLKNGGQYGEPTNIHTHGLHDSPRSPGDNVFLNIPTGGAIRYRHAIPEDHIPGLYWYHPHRHEFTQTQVFAGQAGAIIVKGGLDDIPGVGDVRDRLLIYQAIQFDKDGRPIRTPSNSAPAKQLNLINGQLEPDIDIRPGETQRWRIMNLSSDRFLVLRLQGHRMWMLADDGNPLAAPEPVTTQMLGPGERREVLVRAGNRPGRFKLQSLFFMQVRAQPSYSAPTRDIATMVVSGPRASSPPLPKKLLPMPDLRKEPVARRRRIVFGESHTSPKFYVNGKLFSADRIDQTMKLGTVEEWTVVNTTDEWHTFHIHVNPYQMIKVNGKPVKGVVYNDDVVIAPYGGSFTMRTKFKDFTGKFVFHCHVLFHEDHGMMSTVQVVR